MEAKCAHGKRVSDEECLVCAKLYEIEDRRTARIADLEAVCREALEWLTLAPFDYSNGIVANGCDEGNVNGWKGHRDMIKTLSGALGIEAKTETATASQRTADDDLPF